MFLRRFGAGHQARGQPMSLKTDLAARRAGIIMNLSSSAPYSTSAGLSEPQPVDTVAKTHRDGMVFALPVLPAGEFIGRCHELAFVISTVEHRSSQLLTILGPGGVGKTRLTLTAAWELAPSFRDGVFFIPFTATDPDRVWELIARQLSITNASGESWSNTLLGALRSREMLLILDNCERLIEGFAELPHLLAACPGVMVIATSQEALRVRGEQEFWIQPLALPVPGAGVTADALATSSAVELFAHRARKADPSFTITDANAPDIAAIVQMLDGLPLALELAGAQMRHLSPTALRQRLEKALPSLSGGPRDLPERQQSLINMVEWSLCLLQPHERDMFLQMAVLTGPFTPETAAGVIEGLCPVDGWEILLSFADKSLIKRVVGETDPTPRFFMLQTVHAVTLHLLQRRPELYAAACIRHASFYLAFVREAETHWHASKQLAWLDRMEREHANIQIIIERAMSDPRLTRGALELAEPMFWFWYTRGYHRWALPRIEELLRNAPANIPAHIRGSAHITAGWLAFRQRQIERAERHFRQGLDLIEHGTSPPALRGKIGLAYTISFEGKNTGKAITQLREVISGAKDNPETWHELAAGYFGVGLTEYFARQSGPARESFEASLKISRAYGDRLSIAMNLMYLAHTDRMEGYPHQAVPKLQEVLPLFLDIGDQANIVLGLDVIVSTLVDLGELELALRITMVGENIRRAMGIARCPKEESDITTAIVRIQDNQIAEEAQVFTIDRDQARLDQAVEDFLRFQPALPPVDGEPVDVPAPQVSSVLSSRELEVLRLIASGMTSSQIAASLYVSPHTVKRHMANIRVKLGVRSQAAAVAALNEAG